MGTIFPGSNEPGMDENRTSDRLMAGRRSEKREKGRYWEICDGIRR